MDPFLGQIQAFGFNFAPRGWMKCEGQLLPIAQYSALFSLLGTTYGGDGRTTFGLPDLRGRSAIGAGHGPGLADYVQGRPGGNEYTTLSVANIPSHNHTAAGTVTCNFSPATPATTGNPSGGNFANAASATYNTSAADKDMAANNVKVAVNNTGGGQSFSNVSPYLPINWCIAITGIFPSRS